MNIMVIYSNKRKQASSTYQTAQILIQKLLGNGKLYEFYLPEAMPHICTSCYACIEGHEQKCGGYEYMKPIREAMHLSDLIIFCNPVYVYHTSGQMKILLDHLAYIWMVHRFDCQMMRKQAVIITTAGGAGMKSAVKDVRDSLNFWGVARTYVISQGVWLKNWNEISHSFKYKLEAKADKVAGKILKHSRDVTPCLKVKIMFYVFRSAHNSKYMSEVDNHYWRLNGLLTGKPPWRRW